MSQQMWLPQQHLQTVLHAMGQYRPGSNGPMVRSANMLSLMSPRPQPNVCDETSEYEEMLRELCPAEYRTIHFPSAATPSTVRSMSREQVNRDSASANMAMRPSIVGFLRTNRNRLGIDTT
jgi:hypothetical protein